MYLYSSVSVGGLFAANAHCSIGYYVALAYYIKNFTLNFTRLYSTNTSPISLYIAYC